jgi:hypothetical protein
MQGVFVGFRLRGDSSVIPTDGIGFGSLSISGGFTSYVSRGVVCGFFDLQLGEKETAIIEMKRKWALLPVIRDFSNVI